MRTSLALALLALFSTGACVDPVPAAVPARPAPLPVGTDDDLPPASGSVPSLTSGGGSASSAAHRVQLSVGAPLPRGAAASSQSRLQLEP